MPTIKQESTTVSTCLKKELPKLRFTIGNYVLSNRGRTNFYSSINSGIVPQPWIGITFQFWYSDLYHEEFIGVIYIRLKIHSFQRSDVLTRQLCIFMNTSAVETNSRQHYNVNNRVRKSNWEYLQWNKINTKF